MKNFEELVKINPGNKIKIKNREVIRDCQQRGKGLMGTSFPIIQKRFLVPRDFFIIDFENEQNLFLIVEKDYKESSVDQYSLKLCFEVEDEAVFSKDEAFQKHSWLFDKDNKPIERAANKTGIYTKKRFLSGLCEYAPKRDESFISTNEYINLKQKKKGLFILEECNLITLTYFFILDKIDIEIGEK